MFGARLGPIAASPTPDAAVTSTEATHQLDRRLADGAHRPVGNHHNHGRRVAMLLRVDRSRADSIGCHPAIGQRMPTLELSDAPCKPSLSTLWELGSDQGLFWLRRNVCRRFAGETALSNLGPTAGSAGCRNVMAIGTARHGRISCARSGGAEYSSTMRILLSCTVSPRATPTCFTCSACLRRWETPQKPSRTSRGLTGRRRRCLLCSCSIRQSTAKSPGRPAAHCADSIANPASSANPAS